MKRWTAGLATATLLTASTPAMVAWAGHPDERRADSPADAAAAARERDVGATSGREVGTTGGRDAGATTGRGVGADLVGDVDRDGVLTAADERSEESWSAGRGAVFLANLDDDGGRCRVDPGRLEEVGRAYDDELAACNDAADDRINGPKDAADLAPLKVVAQGNLSDAATGSLTISPADKARVFVDGKPARALSAADLRHGVRAGLEGRDIVRRSGQVGRAGHGDVDGDGSWAVGE